jgi:hypothetical protein
VIRQEAPFFLLPVVVDTGSERKRVWIKGAETAVEFSAPIQATPKLDPDGLLLLKR